MKQGEAQAEKISQIIFKGILRFIVGKRWLKPDFGYPWVSG